MQRVFDGEPEGDGKPCAQPRAVALWYQAAHRDPVATSAEAGHALLHLALGPPTLRREAAA